MPRNQFFFGFVIAKNWFLTKTLGLFWYILIIFAFCERLFVCALNNVTHKSYEKSWLTNIMCIFSYVMATNCKRLLPDNVVSEMCWYNLSFVMHNGEKVAICSIISAQIAWLWAYVASIFRIIHSFIYGLDEQKSCFTSFLTHYITWDLEIRENWTVK